MTSNSWNYRNFWMNEIFGQNFDFVLGEHELIGGRSRNFSKNFGSSWKWRQILRISEILGNDVKFLEFSKFLNDRNFWPNFRLCIRRTWVDRRSFENFFQEFRQFLEMTSNSQNLRNSWKWRQIPGIFQIPNDRNFWPNFRLCIRRTWVDRRSLEKFFQEF